MKISIPHKLVKEIMTEPERFTFSVKDNNLVLNVDNVATSTIFAIPSSEKRVKYVKSYKIEETTIIVKTVTI